MTRIDRLAIALSSPFWAIGFVVASNGSEYFLEFTFWATLSIWVFAKLVAWAIIGSRPSLDLKVDLFGPPGP